MNGKLQKTTAKKEKMKYTNKNVNALTERVCVCFENHFARLKITLELFLKTEQGDRGGEQWRTVAQTENILRRHRSGS